MAAIIMSASQQQSNNPLVRGMQSTAKRASVATQKAKLNADLLFIQQKINATKHQFGIDLYDHLAACADHDGMFLIDGAGLEEIRGIFVTTYKNNKALMQRKVQAVAKLEDCAEQRKVVNSRHNNTLSFEVPADSVGERIMNAPKLARIRTQETKLKGQCQVFEQDILNNKHRFGLEVYDYLLELEKCDSWIPHDPDVQMHYNHARREIAQLELIREEKIEDKDVLDESLNASSKGSGSRRRSV